MTETPTAPGGGNAIASAFKAKVKGVPVLLIGIPVVIIGAMLFRGKGSTTDSTDGDPTDTGQPVFLAKSTPGNWLAVDPTTGVAYNTDGTIYTSPTVETTNNSDTPPSNSGSGGATPANTGLSPHQLHVLHMQHLANTAGSGTVATGSKTSLAGSNKPKSLPKATTVTVRRGDTLSSIASRNGTTVAKLVSLNKIKNRNLIYEGSTLRIR